MFVDIGSNDGLLLRSIRQRVPTAKVGGVEPSFANRQDRPFPRSAD